LYVAPLAIVGIHGVSYAVAQRTREMGFAWLSALPTEPAWTGDATLGLNGDDWRDAGVSTGRQPGGE
jgi:hypothetical protein